MLTVLGVQLRFMLLRDDFILLIYDSSDKLLMFLKLIIFPNWLIDKSRMNVLEYLLICLINLLKNIIWALDLGIVVQSGNTCLFIFTFII